MHRLAAPPAERRRALDVAMGSGRHVALLARSGYRVSGIDVRLDAVRAAMATAAAQNIVISAWCGDLTDYPLPRERFDLVLVTRYLQRDLFQPLRQALTANGVIVYETFTEAQRRLGKGPTSPDHLLQPGELRHAFADLDVMFYEEVFAAEAVARLVARRPAARNTPDFVEST